MKKTTNQEAKTDATLDDLVGQVSSLASATAELLEATNVSKDKIDAAVPSAEQAIDSAAKALADANRADAAADRAEEISGIETVQDALRAAAVPLPDFHLPLNDNLIIREGIGTPYQEGIPLYHADFTRSSAKTYVSKSGKLKIAPINEPAFEQEGILIEGYSTNYVTNSSDPSTWTCNPDYRKSITDWHGFKAQRLEAKAGSGNDYNEVTGYLGITKNATEFATVSVIAQQEGSGGHLRLRITDGTTGSYKTDAVWDMSNNSVTKGKLTHLYNNWYKFEYTYETDIAIRVRYNIQFKCNAGNILYTLAPQLEELPFASSYIPTSGTVATRNGDIITVPFNNYFSDNYTVATQVKLMGYAGGSHYDHILYNVNPEGESFGYIRNTIQWRAEGRGRSFYGGKAPDYVYTSYHVENGRNMIISDVLDNEFLRTYIDGGLKSEVAIKSKYKNEKQNFSIGSHSGEYLFGHIKNFRIWNHALPPEQIGALGNAS